MKKFYLIAICIAFCLSNSVVKSQDLVWEIPNSSGNHTVAITDYIYLNGSPLSDVTGAGALVGAFYTNDNGDLLNDV